MKNGDVKLSAAGVSTTLNKLLSTLRAYQGFIFFLVVAALYGYIVWRINVYSNTPASQSEASAKAATQPHIDPATVQKLQNLQDNSVNVQALFDQARQNPFQE